MSTVAAKAQRAGSTPRPAARLTAQARPGKTPAPAPKMARDIVNFRRKPVPKPKTLTGVVANGALKSKSKAVSTFLLLLLPVTALLDGAAAVGKLGGKKKR